MMNAVKILKWFYCTCVVIFFAGGNRAEDCDTESTAGKSAAVRLSNELLCGYNKNVRPVKNQTTQTVVNTTLFFMHIDMDETMDVLQVSIYLFLSWNDEFLVWDPSKYDSNNYIFEDSSSIWLPAIVSYNMGITGIRNGQVTYSLPDSLVTIRSSGVVEYKHIVTLTSQCSANLANWPFDSHKCTLYIGSPIYYNELVNYSFPYERFYSNTPSNIVNREWKIVKVNKECKNVFVASSNTSKPHCILQYNIEIQRFSSMYYSSVIVPAVVISLMRTFTFLMGRETSLRIILLCLFFVSELLYLQFIDTKIPNNGEHLVYIVILYRNSLMLTAVALITCVISNELYKRGCEDFPHEKPEWLKSVSTFLLTVRPIVWLTNFNTQKAELLLEDNVQEDTPESKRADKAIFWKTLSRLLDAISFLITLVISFINFWFCIPYNDRTMYDVIP